MEVQSLVWDASELQGRVRYQETSPPLLDIEITGGHLDLQPWEEMEVNTGHVEAEEEGATAFSRAARATSRVASRMLTTPTRLLSGSVQVSPGERFFSDEPLDLSLLRDREVHIKGQLAAMLSREGSARDLEFAVDLSRGQLKVETYAGDLNGGRADIQLDVDTTPELPTVALTASFEKIQHSTQQLSAPRTGFLILGSRGRSQAELAAHLDGAAYIELGRGPVNYGNVALLSADVATGVFRALIPGAARRQPELRCGITLAKFTDGIGVTPYGYAARSRTANLMGRIEVDLREEQLNMQFRSRSREGVGLSISNAFSNTVTISGPLTNPAIVPNTTGLLWRGWAAFMTAGISVLGETMINRALASTNPCNDIRAAMRKDLCGSDEPLAASPLVCPP